MSKHVIVISEDALVYEDTLTLRELPVFGSVWKDAARVRHMRSIYPSLTYPCHTSMMTGCYPDRHGIVNNELTNLKEKSSPWHWFYDDVKGALHLRRGEGGGADYGGGVLAGDGQLQEH